jgi:hypothetical protein
VVPTKTKMLWGLVVTVLVALIAGPLTEITKHFLNPNVPAPPPVVRVEAPPVKVEAPPVRPPTTALSRVTGNQNVTGNTVTQGAGSIAQLGGTGNTAIITVPVSRVLSDEKLAIFTDELKKSGSGMLRVVFGSSADDVFPLSQQLCTAARQASWGWACPTSRTSSMGADAIADGLQCYAEDWQASDAAAFKRAIKAAGLSCTYHPSAYDFGGVIFGGTGGVTVVIGSPTR